MKHQKPIFVILAIPMVCVILGAFGVLLYNLPPIHDRLAWRVDGWITQVKYAINPPSKVVFVPQEQVAPIVAATLAALTPSATPTTIPTSTPVPPGPTATPTPSPTPTITPTPLPASVRLEGVKYENQFNRWNYCGPANLSMALNFWGWSGNRDVVGKAIKTSDKDKNVMPYEMVDFASEQPGLMALQRSGGTIDLLMRLISAGFPPIVEKGYYEYDYNGKLGWMGHYQFVTGYDEIKGVVVVQDTYKDGPNFEISFAEFEEGWRSFNYLFLVIYPFEKQNELLSVLGTYADPAWADQSALQTAQAEVLKLTGIDQFFAAFNLGTSNVNLRSYVDAGAAYDQAFSMYALLPDDSKRPFRMMWYQTGPYWAYYYSGRYQDVINLADTTLHDTISEPVLEESLYWRAMAKVNVGLSDQAVEDLQNSLKVHPGFQPSLALLQSLGVAP